MASENLNLNTNWKLCAKWLNDCESLPKPLIIKLYQDQLTLNELACSLRDGVVLCSLLDYLKPGSINMSQVHKQQNLGETLSLENIQLFLDTCKYKFNMTESDLFPPDMLFNLNMESVFQTLSILSKCEEAAERCNGGFHLDFNDNEPENSSMYFSLANNYIDTSYYISFDFYFDETQDIYDKIMNVSDAIGHKNKPRDADFVIREIILTEERHISIMKEYEKHFIRQLSTLLDPEDQRLIAMDFGFLISFHETFLMQLKETCKLNDSRTISICDVFIDFKRKFMTNYTNYILNLPNAVSRFNNLINENPKFKRKIEECMNNSSNTSLKLTDYLTMPFQRVSKYHLLLESLYKKFDGDHNKKKKEKIKEVWLSFREVGLYLNEISRDQDSIIYIEKVMKNLNVKLPYGKTFKDFGRLIREDKIRIKLKNNLNEIARTRTVFLFQTCLIILKKNLFGSYTHFASISIYDIMLSDQCDKNKKNSLTNGFKSLKLDETCLELTDTQISYTYEFYFTDLNQKNLWIEKFKEAKPIDSNLTTNNHLFRLSNFGTEIVECDSCKQNINGIFFQGFKCNYCFQRVHNKCLCLTKVGNCPYDGRNRDSINSTSNRKTLNENIENRKSKPNRISNATLSTSNFINSNNTALNLISSDYIIPNLNDDETNKEKENGINFCKSIYLYNGNPKAPYVDILNFEPGELIQILDSDDDVWWKGCKIDFKCQKADNGEKIYRSVGYFPRSHVKLVNDDELSNELTNFSWYLEGDRDLADYILKQIPTNETIFLVRYNPKLASYAISFKYQQLISHIKIENRLLDHSSMKKVEFNNDKNEIVFYYQTIPTNFYVNSNNNIDSLSNSEMKFYSIDSFRKCFKSIQDLLAFYTIKILKDNEFAKEYDTTLGKSYRDLFALPKLKVVPNFNFKIDSYEFRATKTYFVLEDKNDYYKLFDKNGYITIAPKVSFKIVNV